LHWRRTNRGFQRNGKAGTSRSFDLKTLATITTVKNGVVRRDPLDPVTKRVFTMNGRWHRRHAIDAAEATVAEP